MVSGAVLHCCPEFTGIMLISSVLYTARVCGLIKQTLYRRVSVRFVCVCVCVCVCGCVCACVFCLFLCVFLCVFDCKYVVVRQFVKYCRCPDLMHFLVRARWHGVTTARQDATACQRCFSVYICFFFRRMTLGMYRVYTRHHCFSTPLLFNTPETISITRL